MKALSDIIYRTAIKETLGTVDRVVRRVVSDSRQAEQDALFVAVSGHTTDGHQHIDDAINRGATAIVCEKLPKPAPENVSFIRVADSRKALGMIAANFYDHPSHRMKLVGITGTNGKTTVARLLYDVFTGMGYPCGLISTIGNRIDQQESDTRYTTPDPITINRLLAEMVEAGCAYAFMEVSSHAMVQMRVEALSFTGATFTNITHDHLDYHPTFREYLKAKQSLFDQLEKNSFALTNQDDKNGLFMTQNTRADVKTYSLKALADYKGKLIENTLSGLHLIIDNEEVWCRLTGTFNAYNIMAVYGVGRMLDKDSKEMLTAISRCGPPEGRFDHFTGKDNITGIIDYAHTPDAIENVLKNILEVRTGNEKLITVIGCGGNRDKTKRGRMAAIAATYSDKVIFTSDNPRFEEPETIIAEMIKGLEMDPELKNKYITITNRAEAIHVATVMAGKGDIILVAGKGHEKYQEIKGVRYPFDDKQILKTHLTEGHVI